VNLQFEFFDVFGRTKAKGKFMLKDYLKTDSSTLDQCRSYLEYQHLHPRRPSAAGTWPPPGPAVTISAQAGAGADEVALHLASVLESYEPEGRCPWTVFDRQLVEVALEENHLPARWAKLMPEDRRSYLNDVLDEMMGLRPPSWALIPKIVKTAQHLATLGHVILVGRGAALATAQTSNVFHVRLIASLPRRIERVQNSEHLPPKQAAKFIAENDHARERYVRAYFHKRIDDDLQYHLVLNTDRIATHDAAELIADAARQCFQPTAGDSEEKEALEMR
jgi:hypothetical protein